METMLSSVCEVTSWLDWWLSTWGGLREHLPDEVCSNFERLMLSGSRTLEFLGGQGVTALSNLVLSRRDSLLLDVCSTIPAEEVARLHYSALPSSSGLFPTPLLDSALTKMLAASNDALVQRTLHPPKIPQKSLVGPVKAGSSSASSADRRPPPLLPSRVARVRLPFRRLPVASAAPGESEKRPGKSSPDGVPPLLRVAVACQRTGATGRLFVPNPGCCPS